MYLYHLSIKNKPAANKNFRTLSHVLGSTNFNFGQKLQGAGDGRYRLLGSGRYWPKADAHRRLPNQSRFKAVADSQPEQCLEPLFGATLIQSPLEKS